MPAAEVLAEAAARRAEDAGRVRLVDHRHGAVPAAERQEARQVEQVAVHAEDCVGDDEDASRAARGVERAGEVVQVAAGMLYGPLGGTVVVLVGAAIASAIVFQLVHALGAPFVRAMVSDSFLEKFRAFEKSGKLNVIVFILFLIPGLPKDVFTYIVGLTDMKLGTFLALSILGRTPGVFVSSFAASSIMEGEYLTSAIVFGVLAVLAALGVVFRDKIMDRFAK